MAGEHLSGPRCWQHSSGRLSCWRACSPVSCPETEHKGALTCLHLAPLSVQGVSVRMGPVIGTGSLGPISPQRSHYHVIWSGGDTVCMESLGRLQGGADLTPVLITLTHAWGLVMTPGNYWEGPQGQLSRGQGEFSVFPVGEPKFRVKVITGRDTHSAPGLPSLFPVGHFPSWSYFSKLFQSVFSLIISMWSGGWSSPEFQFHYLFYLRLQVCFIWKTHHFRQVFFFLQSSPLSHIHTTLWGHEKERKWKLLSRVRLFATPRTIQSTGFSSSGSSQPRSPALQADSLPAEPQGKPRNTGVGNLSLLQQIFPT